MLKLYLPIVLEATIAEDKTTDVDKAISNTIKEISIIKTKAKLTVVNFLGILIRILFFGICNRCGNRHVPSQWPNHDPATFKRLPLSANYADYLSQVSNSWLTDT